MSFEAALLSRLREMLAEVDLATTTERQLRTTLEGEFGRDLKEYKPLIRESVNQYLQEQQGEEEEEEQLPATTTATQDGEEEKVPSGPLYILSEEMADFIGSPQLQRTQCLKRVWQYIKANQLQDGKAILLDDTLGRLFEAPLDAGQLMKQLPRHLLQKVEGSSLPRPKAAKRKASAAEADGKKPRTGGYQKPLRVTSQLALFLGKDSCSRPEAVKAVWAYIKENELQDPTNKRNILCDENLRNLFSVDKFQGFSMMKYLNKHFIPDD
mmetsp:Transcript_18630/g.52056  ORF Transcript_18630/g.52056 Transcript_18630/m.52056 type:complete len:268 (+) Transcript_18630:289-1092(+)